MTATKIRLTVRQHTPPVVPVLFQEEVYTPGENYYHAKLADAILGDCPEFRVTVGKSRWAEVAPIDAATSVVKELNEGRGLITLSRIENGVTTGLWFFASNRRFVYEIDPRTWKAVRVSGLDTLPEPPSGSSLLP